MQMRRNCWFIISVCLVLPTHYVAGEDLGELPSFAEIKALVDQHFSQQPHLRTGDIISQSDVLTLFSNLEAAGWKVDDRDKILNRMLSTNDPLVKILRSPDGNKFMSQVATNKLIYDRLDRIVQESGGQRLLTDLVKLPDAARFAKQRTRPGVPDLVDFLPKDRSGKTRRVKDYDKATEKIYTVSDFTSALQESYEATQQRSHN